WCDCKDCRSVLSPAAYLVDLLRFLDPPDAEVWQPFLTKWKTAHGSAPYPFTEQAAFTEFQDDWNTQHPGQDPPRTEIMPLKVLLSRRPDLEDLQLTCENTNTKLPYVDLVNEVLESYVTYLKSLEPGQQPQGASIIAHDTGDATQEELDANSQYTSDDAYKL